MAFLNGSVSFSRFRIHGGGPKRLDENLLEKLRANRVGADKIQHSDYEDCGWIGGRHLLDLEFDLEKNILLDCLHFGMRIDAHKPPPELVRAYEQLELDALLKEANGNGRTKFARLRKEAREAAKGRIEREIKDGRYRRQKQTPVLLDTQRDIVYVAATTPAMHERLLPLFKDTFGKRLEMLTAGAIATVWAESHGLSRKLEALDPAAFIPHPDGNGHNTAYWTSHDPAARDWLGNEFLLWLWYAIAEETDTFELEDNSDAAVVIVKQLALECPWAETGKETITCDGPTRLPESRRAIQSGKLPRKAGLILSRHGQQYELTIQAETFNISGAALPKVEHSEGNGNSRRGSGENGDTNGHGDLTGRAKSEERLEQVRHLAESVDLLYGVFLKRRLGPDWQKTRDTIRIWLRSGAGDERTTPAVAGGSVIRSDADVDDSDADVADNGTAKTSLTTAR